MTTQATLDALLEKKRAKTDELMKMLAAHKATDGRYDDKLDIADLKARDAELNDIGKDYLKQKDLFDIETKAGKELEYLNTPQHPSAHGSGSLAGNLETPRVIQRKSLSQRVLDSKEFKGHLEWKKAGGSFRPYSMTFDDAHDLDTKTVMTETGTGFAPPNYRTNVVILSAQRRPVVGDLIPQDPTMLEAIKYMLETTFTNNAAATAEGGVAPSSLVGYTEEVVLVQWIPTILPVTDQQLEDVPQLMGILNNRLTLMVGLAEESQIVTGNNSSPQLNGFLNASNVLTQAMSTDPIFDAILKGITQVRYTGFAEPSGIVMHPTDWQTARLVKTTIGSYVMGSPDTVGPEMLFGQPVIVTPVITQGTSLLGAFNMYSQIFRRWGLRIEIGYINDDFARGQKTIRASTRLALVIYRPQAFCTVTGIHS